VVPAAAAVALLCLGHSPGGALRVRSPELVGCPPALDRRCAAVADASDPFGQCGAGCLGSDVMCGDRLVMVGDDGTQQATRVIAVSAVHAMRAVQLAILLFCGPFVDLGVVDFAATRHGRVEHGAGGVLAEYGVGGVGGDALGGVHGDGVAVAASEVKPKASGLLSAHETAHNR
jgi:hypothetical protein